MDKHTADPDSATDQLGSIIAFEGHAESISTQLRLLPTSSQFLILPSIQCYMPTNEDCATFEAHTYIRKVHEATMARYEAAQAFLQGSTPYSKRLVFMNGGAPSAQALCVREIMRNDTRGDCGEAEAKYNFLVKGGLSGLESQAHIWMMPDVPQVEVIEAEPDHDQTLQHTPRREYEDPITRAMRAAELLDRQTESLQPSNELDLTMASRRRSSSLPMYGYSDNFGDAAPFYVFGGHGQRNSQVSTDDVDDKAPPPPRFSITHFDTSSLHQSTLDFEPEASPACVGESYGPTFLHSPLVEGFGLVQEDAATLRSTDTVVFGEAAIVDLRLHHGKPLLPRVRSMDRVYPPSPVSHRDACLPSDVIDDHGEPQGTRRPRSCIIVPDERDPLARRLDYVEESQTLLLKSTGDVFTLAPVPIEKRRAPKRSSYVDRGTDAEVIVEKIEPFTPVLSPTENLLLYLRDETPDALLDRAIKGYKEGSYPVTLANSDTSDSDTVTDHIPGTPNSQSIGGSDLPSNATCAGEPAVASPSVAVDEYDPFAYMQNSWPPPKPISCTPTMRGLPPPTPEQTPTPSVAERDEHFYEFRFVSTETAVTTQNSLRSVLSTYFPPDTQGYRQFQFSLLPELDELWKPIFREAEPGSPRSNNRRTDQIIAIGAQKAVKKEYSSAIIGLLDKLGTKPNGASRSGRLDFRYLLANAMQAFTAQPLAKQTADNPFRNPFLLATLIIPHLETYLALHSEVRYLLLEYPPEHLSTVLALQRLVGVEVMKVAQIVNSKGSEPMPFTHIRGASISKNPESTAIGHWGKPVGSSHCGSIDLKVSKANFLLTSSASDSEIATFIATVRKILMDVSDFYAPVEPLKPLPKRISEKKPRPLSGTFSPFPRTAGPQSSMSPTHMTKTAVSPTTSTHPGASAETVRTSRSAKSRTGRSPKSRRRPPTANDDASIMTFDPADDSDYDMEERRLMPIFMQKPTRKSKPNSRKALKFLGLA